MKRRCLIIVAFIILIMFAVGCSEQTLLGKWKTDGGTEELIYEFSSDSTFWISAVGKEDWNVRGTYQIDGDTVYLMMENQSVVLKYSIQNGKLSLSGNNMESLLERIK